MQLAGDTQASMDRIYHAGFGEYMYRWRESSSMREIEVFGFTEGHVRDQLDEAREVARRACGRREEA